MFPDRVNAGLRAAHGHAAVAWHDERGRRLARERQEFEERWGVWT